MVSQSTPLPPSAPRRKPPRPPSAPSLPSGVHAAPFAPAAAHSTSGAQSEETPLLPRSSPPHAPRPSAIAASTSFFLDLPRTLSSASLRSRLGLHPPATPAAVDLISLAVVYAITLVSEASRGLMLPSTWPYLRSLGGTKADLGLFVASFSVGRMATTVPLGYLSDNFSTGAVLAVASLIQVVGHLAYALAPSLRLLIAARVVVGFGSATMSVCRAHLTRAVSPAERTHHFAYLSALQFIGFAVLPAAGGLLAELPEWKLVPGVHFNGYTYPAYVLAFCNLICAAVIYMFYFDPPTRAAPSSSSASSSPPRGPAASASSSPAASVGSGGGSASSSTAVSAAASPAPTQDIDASSDDSDADGPSPDALALIVCLLVNITFRGIVAELETVATPFLMEQYDISFASSSYYISTVGFLGLGVYINFKPLARRVSDRDLLLAGLLFVVVGATPLSYTPIASHLSLGFYVAALGMLWSLAYPIGQTAVLALFSKVLAGLPAGGFLGLFSASGSLARILFALFAGKVWSEFGRDAVFATILGYVALSGILVVLNYSRLVSPTG